MLATLPDGTTRAVAAFSATAGMRFSSVTLTYHDVMDILHAEVDFSEWFMGSVATCLVPGAALPKRTA